MINESILTDKLKYIMITELGNEFQFINFDVELSFVDYETKEEIESYDVDMKFDYQGVIDAEMNDFFTDITKMLEKIRSVLERFAITKSGKLIHENHDYYVSNGSIFNVDFDYDEKHEFSVFFRVNYN
jgi:hypothetical protein